MMMVADSEKELVWVTGSGFYKLCLRNPKMIGNVQNDYRIVVFWVDGM
jgi:hypothetical protein